MARLFINPYTGHVQDWDSIDGYDAGGGEIGKKCPTTGQPLNRAALKSAPYAGPEGDRAAWLKDQAVVMDKIDAQVNEHNAATLGVSPSPTHAVPL